MDNLRILQPKNKDNHKPMQIACIQCWDTPDDGQGTFPKRAEYFIK